MRCWPAVRAGTGRRCASLYPSVDAYTQQLRALESYAVAHPDSADARFLLGYHYMTEGYEDAAIRQFTKVDATCSPTTRWRCRSSKSPTPAGVRARRRTASDIPLTAPESPVTPRPVGGSPNRRRRGASGDVRGGSTRGRAGDDDGREADASSN